MKRRQFITLLGGAAAVLPLRARARQGERMRRVGMLMGYPENDLEGQAHTAAFREQLQTLGWTEGRNCAERRDNHGYLALNQVGRHFPEAAIFTVRPAEFDRDVLTLCVTGLGKALSECREQAGVWLRRARMEKSDHGNARLLRERRQRPGRRSAEQRDELAALHHSITSSARRRIEVGISMPIALAVFRFTTISNFVGCSIGKSEGMAPCAIRSTNSATRAKSAVMLGP